MCALGTSPIGGGKFPMTAVYAPCFGSCVSPHIAVPHPSRLTAIHLPPRGKVFCRSNDTERVREVMISTAPGTHCPWPLAADTERTGKCRFPPHRARNVAATRRRYRAGQGSDDSHRTGARIVRGHWLHRPNGNGFLPFGRKWGKPLDFRLRGYYTTTIRIKQVLNR